MSIHKNLGEFPIEVVLKNKILLANTFIILFVILSKYKPAQLSEEEVAVKVNEAIEQSGASSMQDMGKVMGQLKSLAGSADMVLISKLVKEKLS